MFVVLSELICIGREDDPASVNALEIVVVTACGRKSVVPAATTRDPNVFAPAMENVPRDVFELIVNVP
jgi:hypothetical protein